MIVCVVHDRLIHTQDGFGVNATAGIHCSRQVATNQACHLSVVLDANARAEGLTTRSACPWAVGKSTPRWQMHVSPQRGGRNDATEAAISPMG